MMQQRSLKRCVRGGIILAGLGLLLGCSSSQGPGLIPSTSPLPAGVRGTIPASGSDCQTFFLGLIPITTSPNTQEALKAAKASAHTAVLTDVTVDDNSFYWILFSHRCVRVRGLGVVEDGHPTKVVEDAKAAAAEGSAAATEVAAPQ